MQENLLEVEPSITSSQPLAKNNPTHIETIQKLLSGAARQGVISNYYLDVFTPLLNRITDDDKVNELLSSRQIGGLTELGVESIAPEQGLNMLGDALFWTFVGRTDFMLAWKLLDDSSALEQSDIDKRLRTLLTKRHIGDEKDSAIANAPTLADFIRREANGLNSLGETELLRGILAPFFDAYHRIDDTGIKRLFATILSWFFHASLPESVKSFTQETDSDEDRKLILEVLNHTPRTPRASGESTTLAAILGSNSEQERLTYLVSYLIEVPSLSYSDFSKIIAALPFKDSSTYASKIQSAVLKTINKATGSDWSESATFYAPMFAALQALTLYEHSPSDPPITEELSKIFSLIETGSKNKAHDYKVEFIDNARRTTIKLGEEKSLRE